jgi:hypothetical protein
MKGRQSMECLVEGFAQKGLLNGHVAQKKRLNQTKSSLKSLKTQSATFRTTS